MYSRRSLWEPMKLRREGVGYRLGLTCSMWLMTYNGVCGSGGRPAAGGPVSCAGDNRRDLCCADLGPG